MERCYFGRLSTPGIWTLGRGAGGAWAGARRPETALGAPLVLCLLGWVRAVSQEGHRSRLVLSALVSPSFRVGSRNCNL